MQILTAGALRGLRALAQSAMPDTALIVTVTTAVDDIGGWAETTANSIAVPCRILPASKLPQEGAQQGRIEAVGLWQILFPAGTVIGPSQRVAANGRMFEVVDVLSPRSFEAYVEVLAKESA